MDFRRVRLRRVLEIAGPALTNAEAVASLSTHAAAAVSSAAQEKASQ
jgi:hypothetical protein